MQLPCGKKQKIKVEEDGRIMLGDRQVTEVTPEAITM